MNESIRCGRREITWREGHPIKRRLLGIRQYIGNALC
jgi:hypothetical protein